jgi:hypothetical protein
LNTVLRDTPYLLSLIVDATELRGGDRGRDLVFNQHRQTTITLQRRLKICRSILRKHRVKLLGVLMDGIMCDLAALWFRCARRTASYQAEVYPSPSEYSGTLLTKSLSLK